MDDREQMIRLINIESDTKISTSNDLAYFRITNLAQKILKLELYNVKVNIVLTIALQASNTNENIIFFQLRPSYYIHDKGRLACLHRL